MNKVLVGSVCSVNPKIEGNLSLQQLCSFVPMEYVSDEFGIITRQSIRPVEDVIKGYTSFREKDVLFAKITPCMENGKIAIAKNLKNGFGFGSTEFHVLRANEGEITPDWIFYFLRQDKIRKDAERRMTGSAGQQRVPTSFLQEELEIPLPSFPEQKRIAAILDKADRLRRQRRYAQTLSDSFLQSVFIKMFGDKRKFDIVELESLLAESPKNGLYLPAEKYGRGTPIIRIDNFYEGILDSPINFKRVLASPKEIEEFKVQNGHILINRVNSLEYLGKCAYVQGIKENTLFESNMMRLAVNKNLVKAIYLVTYLTSEYGKSQILTCAKKAVNQASINQTDVESFLVPLPLLSLQEKFAAIVQKFERIRRQQREATRQAEHLFQTLLHRAFRSEL